MIRDRLKKAARKVALKAFGMEKDAEDRAPTSSNVKAGDTEDIEKYIPKLVDGDGDTPGPNDKHLIGRTWLAAQVISAVPGVLLDIRPPDEYAQGHIPGAQLAPGWQIKQRLELVPDKSIRVTVYDAADDGLAREIAQWLRDQGWGMARGLQGGWAEWLEHGEIAATPEPLSASRSVGDAVDLTDGRRGVLQGATGGDDARVFRVLLDAEAGDSIEAPASDLKV